MRPRSRVSGQIKQIKKREDLLSRPELGSDPTFAQDLDACSEKEARARWLQWFTQNNWRPHSFQEEAWTSFLKNESGLISVPTGSGKTFAALGGPLIRMISEGRKQNEPSKLRLLYISPAKALTRDLQIAIARLLRENHLPFRVETRTGDTDDAARAKMRESLPEILVTTPESLALMTAEKDWVRRFQDLHSIVIDEWHEFLGSKRGSLLELTLSRLRHHLPNPQVWAVSATIGNLEEAARLAVASDKFTLIRAPIDRETEISVVQPTTSGIWFGTAGLKLKAEVAESIDSEESTIVFTNTRSQSELWYQALLDLKPEWIDKIALHHGSLEKDERLRVEEGVKDGTIKIVVATSSLDLGVDFPHVKKVIQIGSVKSVSRALQRGGRAEHTMGRKSKLVLCPTNLLEVLEARAVREAIKAKEVEHRTALHQPLDVVIQFLLNSALGGGFTKDQMRDWIHGAKSFENLSEQDLDWAIQFVVTGGASLKAYPDFQKLICLEGRYQFTSPRLARNHRLNIGTITSSAGMSIQYLGGKKIGYADEAFITKLQKGESFQFSGKNLELVRIRDMVAQVRLSKKKKAPPAVWGGQILAMSSVLARRLRHEIAMSPDRGKDPRENDLAASLLDLQAVTSHVPATNEILIERWTSRAGFHVFLYLFEGRSVHEGLGHLMAYRLSRSRPNTISVAANDYGLELLSTEPLGESDVIREALLKTEHLQEDIEGSLNFPEMVKRTFREIARVAGLIQQSAPGRTKTTNQVQMSSSLLFDVFKVYDPQNLLLREAYTQARREQLDFERLQATLQRAHESKFVFKELKQLSPLAFPLFVERTRSQVSSETLTERIERMQKQLFGDLLEH